MTHVWNFQKKQIYRQNSEQCCQYLKEVTVMIDCKWMEGKFGEDERVLQLDCDPRLYISIIFLKNQ
jgi:hypothetical protein